MRKNRIKYYSFCPENSENTKHDKLTTAGTGAKKLTRAQNPNKLIIKAKQGIEFCFKKCFRKRHHFLDRLKILYK